MKSIHHDLDELRALGQGAIGLFNGAILLAVVAVLFAAASQTPQMIQAFLGLVTWLVRQATSPVSGGYNVALTSTLQPAFGGGVTSNTPAGSSGTGGAAGGLAGLGATFTPDGQSTFGTIWDPKTGLPFAGIGDYGAGGAGNNPVIEVHP